MKKTRVLLSSIVLTLMSCQNKSNSGAGQNGQGPALIKSEINLSQVMDSDCLNLQRSLAELDLIYPNPSSQIVTTSVSLVGTEQISENFASRLLVGNFIFKRTEQKLNSGLGSAEQSDCHQVTLKSVGGESEIYQVVLAQGPKIQIKNEAGELSTFEWLSPQHFQTQHLFKTGDFLCHPKSVVWVTVSRDFSWEPQTLLSATLAANLIAPDYLKAVQDGVGAQAPSMSLDGSLVVSDLQSLSAQSLRPELMNCQ